MKTLLAIAAIFVLTGLGWFAWLNIDQEGYNSGILDNPPVIKAVDKNKIKYKPEDPGGREVLNQDRSIFDRGSIVSEDIVESLWRYIIDLSIKHEKEVFINSKK